MRVDGRELRLFLVAWIVFAAHFATNVVREHYPAFSLVDHGDFVLDDYAGFHSDIFQHENGHHYIVNQVTTSILVCLPLLAFDPLLDALEKRSLEQLATTEPTAGSTTGVGAEYRTRYPMRREFFRKVKARGLDLRFGAATVVTSVFFMAPLSALLVIVMLRVLISRGVGSRRAFWLALLFAFGTPLFYRTATLSNNVVLMHCVFASFLCLWTARGERPSTTRILCAGLFAGVGVAVDYAGVVAVPFLCGYLLLRPLASDTGRTAAALRTGATFCLGLVPGIALLLFTQWAMFGNPFLPAQYHMPEVNYTDRGWRGFAWPDFDLFWANLASPNFGLATYGPLLLLGFLPLALARRVSRREAPAGHKRDEPTVLPIPERRFVFAFTLAFLIFCAANQYARMQWNTGFRYLMVLVPFLFLGACDVLAVVRVRTLALLGGVAVLHTWVLSMTRYTVPSLDGTADGNAVLESWRLVLTAGPQLPWLQVLRQTRPDGSWLNQAWVTPAVMGVSAAAVWLVLRFGRRVETPSRPSAS